MDEQNPDAPKESESEQEEAHGQAQPPYEQQEAFAAPPVDNVTQEERTLAMLCHLLAVFTGFLGPLIIWLIKKDDSPFIDDQGKEALNFQLTVLIAMLIAGVTMCFYIGMLLAPAVGIANIVLCIMACIKANEGERYRYPWCIRFVK